MTVLESDTGDEYMNDLNYDTIFVLDAFEGDIYEKLYKKDNRVMGPNVFLQCANQNEVSTILFVSLFQFLIRSCETNHAIFDTLSIYATLYKYFIIFVLHIY